MQQRINNLWLSDELIQAVRLNSDEVLTPTTAATLDHDLGARRETRSAKQIHGRMWQHIATALLLLGSAAFSYLAWSEAELSPRLLKSPETFIPASKSVALDRANVHALRVANRELQLRIVELQKGVAETAP